MVEENKRRRWWRPRPQQFRRVCPGRRGWRDRASGGAGRGWRQWSHRLIGRVPRTLRGWHRSRGSEADASGRSSSPAMMAAAVRASRAAAVSCLRLRSSPVNSTTTITASSCCVCEVRSSRARSAASWASLASTRLRRTVFPRFRRDCACSGVASSEAFLLVKVVSIQGRVSGRLFS